MGIKEEYQESRLRRFGKKIARAFGFGYPSQVICCYDREKNKHYLEDPYIEDSTERGTLPVLKKKEVPDNPKKIPEKIKEKEEREDQEDRETKEIRYNNTLVRSKTNNKLIQIRGSVKEDISPSSILKYYPEAIMVIALPFGIFYTWILLWSIGTMGMGDLGLVLNTVLILTMLYQGHKVLSDGGILTLDCDYKGRLEGLEIYVPRSRRYLSLEPQEEKNIESDTVKKLITWIRPIISKNTHLTETLNNMYDEINKSYHQGMRDRTYEEEVNVQKWILIAVLCLIGGIFIGLMISGSISPIAPSGGTPKNQGNADQVKGIIMVLKGVISW